jgi:two-component system sensor histidine kinase BaeS
MDDFRVHLEAELAFVSIVTAAGKLEAASPSDDLGAALLGLRVDLDSPVVIDRPTELSAAFPGVKWLAVLPLAGGGALYLGFARDASDMLNGLEVLAAHLALVLATAEVPESAARATRSESATESMDELIAMAVHELRTPLTPLTMLLHSIERKVGRQAIDLEAVTRARRQVERLTQMVADLLDLSRLRRNRLPIATATIDVLQALESAATSFRQRRDKPSVSLVLPAAPLLITADYERLPSALFSLMEHLARTAPSAAQIAITVDAGNDEVSIFMESTREHPPDAAYVIALPAIALDKGSTPSPHSARAIAVHLAEQLIARQGGAVAIEEDLRRVSVRVTFPVAR